MIEGKIYKLVSKNTDMIYIGSTKTKYLKNRLNHHKHEYYTKGMEKDSHKLLIWDDAEIILLEKYNCNSLKELRMREQEWLDKYPDYIVNDKRAYNTPEMNRANKKITNRNYDKQKIEWISSMGGWVYGLTLIKV
jgi:hypothetical protein